ncbi:MAG TPA: hypothetical protein VJU77_00925 [Chthoniobacterales bacterium]|nr:hypothetical protein [Chthoniobacterales bacterium]
MKTFAAAYKSSESRAHCRFGIPTLFDRSCFVALLALPVDLPPKALIGSQA